jgi:purine-binding chemotaxis protein CheW
MGSPGQHTRTADPQASGQMLTFRLGEETYGVDVLRVKEIRGWAPVTRIPHTPIHVLGVLNLRGAIIPIIDLRLRFELPVAQFTPATVIVVLTLKTADGQRECGVVVDSVADVVHVSSDNVKPAPTLTGNVQTSFINGLVAYDDHMLILLNMDELIINALASGNSVSAAA